MSQRHVISHGAEGNGSTPIDRHVDTEVIEWAIDFTRGPIVGHSHHPSGFVKQLKGPDDVVMGFDAAHQTGSLNVGQIVGQDVSVTGANDQHVIVRQKVDRPSLAV